MSVNGVSEENIQELVQFGLWLAKEYGLHFYREGRLHVEETPDSEDVDNSRSEGEIFSEDEEPATSTPLPRLSIDERIEAARGRFLPEDVILSAPEDPPEESSENGKIVKEVRRAVILTDEQSKREESGYVSGTERLKPVDGSGAVAQQQGMVRERCLEDRRKIIKVSEGDPFIDNLPCLAEYEEGTKDRVIFEEKPDFPSCEASKCQEGHGSPKTKEEEFTSPVRSLELPQSPPTDTFGESGEKTWRKETFEDLSKSCSERTTEGVKRFDGTTCHLRLCTDSVSLGWGEPKGDGECLTSYDEGRELGGQNKKEVELASPVQRMGLPNSPSSNALEENAKKTTEKVNCENLSRCFDGRLEGKKEFNKSADSSGLYMGTPPLGWQESKGARDDEGRELEGQKKKEKELTRPIRSIGLPSNPSSNALEENAGKTIEKVNCENLSKRCSDGRSEGRKEFNKSTDGSGLYMGTPPLCWQEPKVARDDDGREREGQKEKELTNLGQSSGWPERPSTSSSDEKAKAALERGNLESLQNWGFEERPWGRAERKKRSPRSIKSRLYMNVVPLRRRKPKPARDYRTRDHEENCHNDIDNPDWDDWKRPKNDIERMNHVQRRFGNQTPGDPNRCLTFHGFRRLKAAETDGLCEYNTGIRDPRKIKIENGKIDILETREPQHADGGKRKAADHHEEAPSAKRRRGTISCAEYQEKMIETLERFKKPILYSYAGRHNKTKADAEWRYCLRHFKESLEETYNFARYYSFSNEDSRVLSWDELDRSRCAEMVFSKFAEHYGPNRLNHCKDCSAMENRKVVHQY